jgi:hypothetical protein
MEYIVNDYIESGYFETSIVGIQGEAAIVASFSVAAELFDISDGGNDYLDATYVNPGYFEYVAPASAFIEGAGVLLHNAQISVAANKIVEGNTQGTFSTPTFTMIAIGGKNVEINLVAYSLGGMNIAADKFHGIVQTLASTTQQTANGGKLVLGEAGTISNTYVDSDYIINSYFDGTLTGGLVSFFTQSALVGKRQQGVIGNLTNDYVDPTYLDGGYFFGVSDVIITATLIGDLELFETGFIEGFANFSTSFLLTAEALELTAPQEAQATLLSNVNAFSTASRTRDYNADISTSFNIDTNATKAFGFDSSLSVTALASSTARRTRGYNSSIQSETSVSTINSRIRDNASAISSEFQQTTFGQRARGIDLYAFTNGGLVAQAGVIRSNNATANTFFNVGTDFIRTRNVSAEGDATVFISNIPTRIRDTSLETQDAFSFDSFAVAVRDINESIVSTFVIENVISLTRGVESQFVVETTLDITPNVTREFDSAITSTSTQLADGAKTAGGESNILFESTIIGRGNANLDCDMEAFGDGALGALANARFRANSEMFSIPGFNIVINNVRVRYNQSQVSTTLTSETVAVKIHPMVAEPFSSSITTNILGGRISPTGANFTTPTSIQANGVVRFIFFPTTFTFSVVDEPLADTFFSRTRETGVNI